MLKLRTGRSSFGSQLDRMVNHALTGLPQQAIYVPKSEREIQQEVNDWVSFARQTQIVSGTQLIQFDPYDFQREIFAAIEGHRGFAGVKTRQQGWTEALGSRALFKASRDPSYTAVFFSKSGSDTQKIAERVQMMGNTHPGIRLEIANSAQVKVLGGGTILFRTSTPNSGRGLPSVHEIFFDEWAFVPNARQIYGAAVPSTQMVGDAARIVMVSTPNGRNPNQQFFATLNNNNGAVDFLSLVRMVREDVIPPTQIWTDSSGWAKAVIHWSAHPVYSSRPNYLYQVKIDNNLDDRTLAQEFNLGFDESSSGDLINLDWFMDRRFDDLPLAPLRTVISLDTAQSKRSGSSKWGITIIVEAHFGYCLAWVDEQRMSYTEGRALLEGLIEQWQPTIVLVEGKSSGLDLVDDLTQNPDITVPVLALPVPRSSAGDDPKVRRMSAETPQLEAGKLWLPRSASWLGWVERRLESYPDPIADANGDTSRDFEDSLSQVLRWLRENPLRRSSSPVVTVGQQRSVYGLIAGSSQGISPVSGNARQIAQARTSSSMKPRQARPRKAN